LLSSCGPAKPGVIKKENIIVNNPPTQSLRRARQFVLLSFDGSESIAMWQKTRDFAKEMKLKNKPVNFTYFISSVYFLPPNTKDVPSLIGYSRSIADITKRIEQVELAQSEGHEIASHMNGHYRSTDWSVDKWMSEFDVFNKISPVKVMGFRSPLLSRNENLYKVLPQYGYKYDSSGVGKMGEWPIKNIFGTWDIPIVTIALPGGGATLSMDYNIYLSQTGAKDILKKGSVEWNKNYNQAVGAYQNYFDKNYKGSRAPVVIGNHFSLWNDGLYFEALKSFAENVCGMSEVKCGTFEELVEYLEKKPQP
jgi:hypothetical protein